jgi:hypothetical protein
MMIKNIALIVIVFIQIALTSATSHAQPSPPGLDQARIAAKDILDTMAKGMYQSLWDKKTSQWFKGKIEKNVFISNMSLGRPQLGNLTESEIISIDYATSDQATGYTGHIYAVNFRNKYTVGEFFERIVLIKESDGGYRLSGIFGSPVPKN